MYKKIAALAAATVGMLAFVTGPAAATTETTCWTGRICGWEQENGNGGIVALALPDNTCWDLQGARLSAYNLLNADVTLSEGDCSSPGRSFYIRPGQYFSSLPYAVRSASRCSIC
ncbi:peptidase inhibitor family I36 protein [Amycolatopsis japonica]|uniref:peptidase inhibitor family I36 protein n=1 Tax=Amycolatopsis japonica TaxID=208439 RepID=UPI00331E13A1